jgi:proteasome-associated ATPase
MFWFPIKKKEITMSDDSKIVLDRDVYLQMKETIQEQNEEISRMMAAPHSFGEVIKAGNEFILEAFAKNDRLMILDPKLTKQGYRFGKIASKGVDSKGYLTAEFSDGTTLKVNIGLNGEMPQVKLIGKNDGLSVDIMQGGNKYQVHGRPGLILNPGDEVTIDMMTKQIVDKTGSTASGAIANIVSMIDSTIAEVEVNGSNKVVQVSIQEKVKNSDRVLLDPSSSVAIKLLPRQNKDQFSLNSEVNIDWSDIAGLDDAKEALIEAVEMPIKQKYIYDYYKISRPKGILLYGPQGCGKTLCGKGVATALSRLYGVENVESGFIYVKGPEILNMYVGNSESNVRRLFARGKQHYETYGYPATLFIDEADAILSSRGSGKSSDMETTIVPQFLSEMDGMEESGVMVMLATNQPKRLDPAITRPGRIDQHIKINRPISKNAVEYFRVHMKNIPFSQGLNSEEVANIVVNDIFDERRVYCAVVSNDGSRQDTFRFSDVVNGATIASICNEAKSYAFKRDIKSGKPKGVGIEDFQFAVQKAYMANKDLNLGFDLDDFCDKHNIQRGGVRLQKLPLAS